MKPGIKPGDGPLLLAQPHGGTVIPDSILARLNHHGEARADTDWHIDRLYADLLSDITIVSTSIHRYVIDANRDPADESLYPTRFVNNSSEYTKGSAMQYFTTAIQYAHSYPIYSKVNYRTLISAPTTAVAVKR